VWTISEVLTLLQRFSGHSATIAEAPTIVAIVLLLAASVPGMDRKPGQARRSSDQGDISPTMLKAVEPRHDHRPGKLSFEIGCQFMCIVLFHMELVRGFG